jgi:hypothetical protein
VDGPALSAPDLAGTPRASTTRRPKHASRPLGRRAVALARGHALSRGAQDQRRSRRPARQPRRLAPAPAAEAAIARELEHDGQLAHDRGGFFESRRRWLVALALVLAD